MTRPPLPPFRAETAAQKARHGRRCLEHARSRARRACLHAGQPLAEPRGILPGPRSDRSLPRPQMAARTRLPPDQGNLGFRGNRIAVRFAYEWRDDSGNWFRSYGNENWEFDEDGLMRRTHRQHQRSADPRERAQIPLAARQPPGRSPRR